MPVYTLDELIKKMEPQTQRDMALINQCVEGLGLYAAQIAQINSNSSKIDEMRKLVENLVGYWGLDVGEQAPSQNDFLQAFDDQIFAAKSGAEINGDTYRRHIDTIYGLHRYGQDMVVSQGNDATSEILGMGDLMKELATHWNFEPYDVVDRLSERLRIEVWNMLADIPLSEHTNKHEVEGCPTEADKQLEPLHPVAEIIGSKSVRDEKPSLLEQIQEKQKALKQSSTPKSECDKKHHSER